MIDGVTWGEQITFGGKTHYMEYMRDENGEVYGFIYDRATYYLEKNALGDVKYLLDSSGNVLAKYTYDEWGKKVSVTDASGNAITDGTNIAHLNPFRYRSYYYDDETGLYYLGSRYYDPVTCRFVNADARLNTKDGILGYNMFAYCLNNPIVNADFYGFATFSFNIGFSIFVFGKGFSHSISFVSTKDRIGIQHSKCVTYKDNKKDSSGDTKRNLYQNSPKKKKEKNDQVGVDIGVTASIQYTEKDTLEELEEYSTAIGGDISSGVDILLDGEDNYMGWQYGFTTPVSFGYHRTTSYTTTLFSIPTFDLPKRLKEWLW